MSNTKYKPGSTRGMVHKAYDDKGEAAARKIAAELRVKSGRLERWLRLWSGQATRSSKGSQPPTTRAPAAAPAAVSFTLAKRYNVCWRTDPRIMGTVQKRGKKTSDVLWANGNEIPAVNNKLLTFSGGPVC